MILAGTGHRPPKLGGYGEQVHIELVTLATEQIKALKPDLVISGMALGWDQAIARASMLLKIPFDAYVPFEGQERMWPRTSQENFTWLLARARRVLYVCPPGYAAWKMQARNEAMVDDCDRLLALWDGSAGGTANCVRYAQSKGKEIVNCWQQWKEMP